MKYIAHRGLYNELIPENSLLAFKNALEKNIAIEFDIRMTKDNVLVVFHDSNTKRLTDIDKELDKSTYDEIKKLRLNNTNEGIPTLKEVLNLINGKVFLDIEIKSRKNKVRKFVKLIKQELNNYNGKYSIKSFNPYISYLYKKNNKSIECGVLSYNHYNKKIPSYLMKQLNECRYLFYKPDFISYSINDYNDNLDNIFKKRNIPVTLWTIDNLEKLNKAIKYTDTIIFEKIDIKKSID